MDAKKCLIFWQKKIGVFCSYRYTCPLSLKSDHIFRIEKNRFPEKPFNFQLNQKKVMSSESWIISIKYSFFTSRWTKIAENVLNNEKRKLRKKNRSYKIDLFFTRLFLKVYWTDWRPIRRTSVREISLSRHHMAAKMRHSWYPSNVTALWGWGV